MWKHRYHLGFNDLEGSATHAIGQGSYNIMAGYTHKNKASNCMDIHKHDKVKWLEVMYYE